MKEVTPLDAIKSKIHTIRGKQVILDRDLAELYEVETKALNQAVKRNIERFPERYMFQLTKKESENLRCQIVSSDLDHSLRSQVVTLEKQENLRGKHIKYLPYCFTEQGVAMLSTVLRSKKAIDVSILIMDAFVSMRKFLSQNAEVFQRLDRVELKQIEQDKRIDTVFKALETEKPKHATSRLVSS
jgi:phage regulator Rha-like protein